jgi:hypothetical protein
VSADAIQRALAYPYAAPAGDYLFTGGAAGPLPPGLDLTGRTPVLAVGSNRAPEQLRRKFGDAAAVPVTWARLRGFDVVYSAHMAGYGAIPATLHPSPGTVVTVALTWLDEAQLTRMHETEAVGVSYDYGSFRSLEIDVGPGRAAESVGCYITKRGALRLDGAPVALAEIAASGRRFSARRQPEKLARVHARFGAGESFEDWLAGHIGSADRRRALVARLAETAELFAHPAFAPTG